MRNIINISVPERMKKEIEYEVKEGSYASTSEFIRDLVREWMQANLLRELKQSQKDITVGKGRVLRSLRDLR